jgi:hypothetical protein
MPAISKFYGLIIRLAVEWAELHRAELMANWERARRQEALEWIDGLE